MKVELLAPAGDLERLKFAYRYGADAVYIGGKAFSLRARASNFDLDAIHDAAQYANAHGKKLYVTTNIYPHPEDLDGIVEYLHALEASGVHAIIAAAPSIVTLARKHTQLEVHLSTQQSTLNRDAIRFWHDRGVERVVLARELDIEAIAALVKNSPIELEAFIHGGMCMSYSGKCTLSNTMTDRDANRGGCAHSCRWFYTLKHDGRDLHKGVPFSMSSKDLSALSEIPALLKTGVASLKIEGRMKSVHYIATVVNTYRRLIDAFYETPDSIDLAPYQAMLEHAENRETASGFLGGETGVEGQLYNMRSERVSQRFAALVESYDPKTREAIVSQRNYFTVGDTLEIFRPSGEAKRFVLDALTTIDHETIEVARHPKQRLRMRVPVPVEKRDIIRKL